MHRRTDGISTFSVRIKSVSRGFFGFATRARETAKRVLYSVSEINVESFAVTVPEGIETFRGPRYVRCIYVYKKWSLRTRDDVRESSASKVRARVCTRAYNPGVYG